MLPRFVRPPCPFRQWEQLAVEYNMKHMRLPILALAAALCAAGQTAPPKKSALDKATLEAYVRHLYVWGPQINVRVHDPVPSTLPGFFEVVVSASAGNASQDEMFYVSKDGQKIVRGMMFDIARNPFDNDLKKIKTELQPSFGTPGATVVIVMFSDFQCSFCKEEAQTIRQNLAKTYPKQVRVYFKDFPLDQIHPWARTASIAGRCVFRQEPATFWDYHDWVFEHQGEINPENFKTKIQDFAKEKNLDAVALTRCIDTRATEPEVNRNVAEGKALQINSTPTLFINGRRLVGKYAWEQLKAVIDYEIEYQKTAKNAGEDCGCEIKLPTPLNN